jgi:hypothetical protein
MVRLFAALLGIVDLDCRLCIGATGTELLTNNILVAVAAAAATVALLFVLSSGALASCG